MENLPNIEMAWIDRVREQLAKPLPGPVAQYKMASMRRIEELAHALPAVPENARVAAVLNLLHWRGGAWRTVLIHRTENPNDRHSKQVSFPGGRFELTDGSLANAALREAEEEIGAPRHKIELLGGLTQLYIPVSNYIVHPFVGVLVEPIDFAPQTGEVDAIITPSLAQFTRPEVRQVADIRIDPHLVLKNTPYFDVEGHMVWGATAMILNEFIEVIR